MDYIFGGVLALFSSWILIRTVPELWRDSDRQRYKLALKHEQSPQKREARRSCGHLWASMPLHARHDMCPICFYEILHPEAKRKREAKATAGALSFAQDNTPEGALTVTKEKEK